MIEKEEAGTPARCSPLRRVARLHYVYTDSEATWLVDTAGAPTRKTVNSGLGERIV